MINIWEVMNLNNFNNVLESLLQKTKNCIIFWKPIILIVAADSESFRLDRSYIYSDKVNIKLVWEQ